MHVPFCASKCPYCAFASDIKRNGDEDIYLESTERELQARISRTSAVGTLYIGGGTPSVLSVAAWEKLIGIIEKHFSFTRNAEVTVEANPGSIAKEHAAIWRAWRVTRISLGIQSFSDKRLRFLCRAHGADEARNAIALCLGAGFSVSFDLIFGLPGETLRDWMNDIKTALSFGTRHISIYQLTIEENTPFARENFYLPDGYAQYRYAQWRFARAGFEQYEIASFAKPGHECLHNLNYWDDGEYIGIGPSACGYIGGERWTNARTLDEYAAMTARGLPTVSAERLKGERAARQAAILALRAKRGIDWESFRERYGTPVSRAINDELKRFPPDLVENTGGFSKLTPKGFRLGNAIWSEIV